MAERVRFAGTIRPWKAESIGGMAVVDVPSEAAASLGGLKQIRVRGSLNDTPFTGSTMPAGGGRLAVAVSKAMMTAASVAVGDDVRLELERDDAPRPIALPDELSVALAADPTAARAFAALTESQRRQQAEHVAAARRPETRARRLEELLIRLREEA